MDYRVAVISIIVEDNSNIEQLNGILHEYGEFILGRMGLPYKKRGISIISIALDAPQDKINTLAGRIGRIAGLTAKTAYSNNIYPQD